jgi:hypothetical protein
MQLSCEEQESCIKDGESKLNIPDDDQKLRSKHVV